MSGNQQDYRTAVSSHYDGRGKLYDSPQSSPLVRHIDDTDQLVEPFNRVSIGSKTPNTHPGRLYDDVYHERQEKPRRDARAFYDPNSRRSQAQPSQTLPEPSRRASVLERCDDGVRIKAGEEWQLLKWTDLHAFLMDPANTRTLPENDVIRRTADFLQKRDGAKQRQRL